MYIIQQNNTLLCSGTEPMFIPAGGNHVRQCFIRIPFGFSKWPAISISIYSFDKDNPQNTSGGAAMVPWAMEDAGSTGTETVVKISAINTDYQTGADFPYVCSYVIMGELENTVQA
jgi:hypothetical protein